MLVVLLAILQSATDGRERRAKDVVIQHARIWVLIPENYDVSKDLPDYQFHDGPNQPEL